jgi:hypothetical protein
MLEEEEHIQNMVYRFLSWKLPDDFRPDAGISFTPDYNVGTDFPMKHKPTGTNLFSYTQAEAMVRHMLEREAVINYTDDWMNPPKSEAAGVCGPEYPRYLIMRQRMMIYQPFKRWDVWLSFGCEAERNAEFERLSVNQPAWQIRCADELHAPLSYN